MRIFGGDSGSGYATFSGFAAVNDGLTLRWGLLQEISGGYLWKGLMTLGYSSAVDFRDANTQIIVDNTKKVHSDFNHIDIRQSGSRVDWTSISFLALGTQSPGNMTVVDDADVTIDSCTFTDMGRFNFLAGTTIVDSTFRRCGMVVQGDAVLQGTLFTASGASVALYASDLDKIDYCSFVSVGTCHAIEMTDGMSGGSYTLLDVAFTGYASTDGDTGNEAIFNNSGGPITLLISGGDTPSIRNGSGASTTVVIDPVDVTVTVKNIDGEVVLGARVFLAADDGGPLPYEETVSEIQNIGTTAGVTHYDHGMSTGDKVLIKGASLDLNNGVHAITVGTTNYYEYTMDSAPGSSPTGTITATFVFLYGLVDDLGQITMSRALSSDQPVYGWARKAS